MNTVTIDIRPADMRDAADVAQVHDNSWLSTYRGIIPQANLERMIVRRGPIWWQRAIRRGVKILVLDFDGVIAGYATVGKNRAQTLPFDGEIFELYLEPEFQGVGLGTRLFINARDELARLGMNTSVVWVLDDNEAAIRFYENAGGRRVSKSLEAFGDVKLPKSAFAWD
jgi:ribosomal protein S18 acetylase RimI-like enzyme